MVKTGVFCTRREVKGQQALNVQGVKDSAVNSDLSSCHPHFFFFPWCVMNIVLSLLHIGSYCSNFHKCFFNPKSFLFCTTFSCYF